LPQNPKTVGLTPVGVKGIRSSITALLLFVTKSLGFGEIVAIFIFKN
jgi:hypothetical protein